MLQVRPSAISARHARIIPLRRDVQLRRPACKAARVGGLFGLPSSSPAAVPVWPSGQSQASFRNVSCAAAAAGAAPGGDVGPVPQQTPAGRAQVVKVALLGVLFFLTTSCYTILQNLKDSLIVTKVGAEALPFLEAYGVLPVSIGFYMLYNRLNQRLPEKWVYQAALLPFLSYYALFGAVLFPLADKLHPTHLLEGIRSALPAGLAGLAGMVVNWSYSLFFIMGELWGGVAISLLFWGLADEVCSVREAESVYPLLGIIANVGLVLAGAYIKMVNNSGAFLAGFGLQPLQALIATVLVTAVVLFVVKAYIHDQYVTPDAHEVSKAKSKDGKKKPAKSLAESLSVLKKSRKVGNLAVLVIAYFISQKLFDFAWKAQLRVMYPCPHECQQVLAEVAQWTGVTTIALMLTSKWVFRNLGWSAAALATPVFVLGSGMVFFASAIVMQGGATSLPPQMVGWLLAAGGVAGMVGRVASRAPKYSLFDPAKEMVYITMTKAEKNEGKATVDLLGSTFGKSGASCIMQALVLGLGSLQAAMPIMALVHVCVGVAWTRATFSLGDIMKEAHLDHEVPSSKSTEPPPPSPSPEPEPIGPVPGSALQDAVLITAQVVVNGEPKASAPGNGHTANGNGHTTGHANGHSNGNGNGNGNGLPLVGAGVGSAAALSPSQLADWQAPGSAANN